MTSNSKSVIIHFIFRVTVLCIFSNSFSVWNYSHRIEGYVVLLTPILVSETTAFFLVIACDRCLINWDSILLASLVGISAKGSWLTAIVHNYKERSSSFTNQNRSQTHHIAFILMGIISTQVEGIAKVLRTTLIEIKWIITYLTCPLTLLKCYS